MTYGTSYFVSEQTAIRYYRDYEPHASTYELRDIVQRKVAEGLIHIGQKPPLKDGEVLSVIDGSRYAISDGK